MRRTILVVGATGNTGRSVVKGLSQLLGVAKFLTDVRILALTRSLANPVALEFRQLPGVEVAEANWVETTEAWLKEQNVIRMFVASHNEPNQFAEESQLYVNALRSGVKYIVRISTTAANVRPDCLAYYPRSHWAIEQLLKQPEYKNLHWTSLQPNLFLNVAVGPAVEFIKHFRKTGEQISLKLMLNANTPMGAIDSDDVGSFAASLLAQDDTSEHNQARYVMNGPEDITGEQIVQLVEEHIGEKVTSVMYKNMDFVDAVVAQSSQSSNIISSIKGALETAWEGKCRAQTTSMEVYKLSPPKGTVRSVLDAMLEAQE